MFFKEPVEADVTSKGWLMRKIVLTGGPCSGKTTVQRALREEFGDSLVVVPEVATMLLAGGFPAPGEHFPWTPQWQAAFQAAVLPVQRSLEDACTGVALARGCRLLVCDRGILDGAAYTPGGVAEFCRIHGLDVAEALARYHAVLHLESLATADPEKYGKAGNDCRFEPLEQAQRLEHATRAAWAGHPRHLLIESRGSFEVKVAAVLEAVRSLLADASGALEAAGERPSPLL
jgi:predicted ATPase